MKAEEKEKYIREMFDQFLFNLGLEGSPFKDAKKDLMELILFRDKLKDSKE